MNPILSQILSTRRTLAADGISFVDLHSGITSEEGRMLSRLIARYKPNVSLEVGLAFGISALFICEAMKEASPTPKHIVIDPAQHAPKFWQGIGLANLERAGYRNFVEFIEKPSQLALPELVAAGTKVNFAFIDGEHLFDHALVDFFFIDQLLNVGGVIVLDDAGWPSIRRLSRFIASNRSYRIVDHVGADVPGKSRHLKFSTPQTVALDQRLGLEGECIAMEKMANDTRHYSDYSEF